VEAFVKDQVVKVIEATLDAMRVKLAQDGKSLPAHATFQVDPPKQAGHGDFACNVAMVMAKSIGMNPRALAEMVVAHLVDTDQVVSKIDIAGPGFLNITLSADVYARAVRSMLGQGDRWGTSAATNTRVLVEFVSANPTGPVHIGHARGLFMGDAVSRLLAAAGHDVTREYYINDFGKQVETLGRTVYKRYSQLFGDDVVLAEGEYPASYVIDIAKTLRDEDGDKWRGQPEAAWLQRCIDIGVRENMNNIRRTLAAVGVQHDVYASEAALHAAGKVRAVADTYQQRGATYDAPRARQSDDKVRREESKAAQYEERQQGGTFLRTSDHGDEEDRIILRHDKTPVYLTADLAYHQHKFERGFDRIINVFGADHAGHVPRLRAGMHLLGFDEKKLEFVLVQIVRLVRDGQEVKISKRKGTVYELADLLEEAGGDACRFFFLMKSANSQMDFDLDLIGKNSRENPVFSMQYGHARCAAIVRKATELGQSYAGTPRHEVLLRLQLPEERLLIKKMSLLPEVVRSAAAALEPHRVLYFCQELISEFHGYYTKYKNTERVVSPDLDMTQARLAMVTALKQTLRCAFHILGVDAPEQMQAPADDEADHA
jgi:arginyl-tRNA synthetase